MDSPDRTYDAAVVGGGIVGLATALALAAGGGHVAVVEREPPRRMRGDLGTDIRTVALTPASVDCLESLGGIERGELTPIEAMRVWECDGAAALDFRADGPLAWVAEHSALTTRLWQTAAGRVDRFAPARVAALAHGNDAVTLDCRQNEGDPTANALTIAARLVIAADGAGSQVRAMTGVAVRGAPVTRRGAQYAIATVARTVRPHRGTAWQRFGATGPAALLPLPDNRKMAVIWSTDETTHERLKVLDDDAFRAALENETEAVAGGIEAVDRRIFLPLGQTLAADPNPMPRVVLAGDAARTLHPLAGQGVNLGLEDVRAIAATATAGTDFGAAGNWRAFARQRRARSKLMMTLMRALLAAYCGPGADGPWMRLARNTAIRWIDSSAIVKAQLVREAMGLGPLAAS